MKIGMEAQSSPGSPQKFLAFGEVVERLAARIGETIWIVVVRPLPYDGERTISWSSRLCGIVEAPRGKKALGGRGVRLRLTEEGALKKLDIHELRVISAQDGGNVMHLQMHE